MSDGMSSSDRVMSTTLLPTVSVVAVLAADLMFTIPDGWQKIAITSSMRVADFSLPRADGDAEDAELVLYYFGGGGGNLDANIARWVGQMQQPDGTASSAAATRETRKVNGLPYFIKLTGPEKTIAKWDAAFNQFVGSMQFK